ncbi:hypothetical protein CYMTET_34797, partial [Cymbomonas tetramitiformis]
MFFDYLKGVCTANARLSTCERIFLFMSESGACRLAHWLALFVMLVILGSTVSFVIETEPDWQVKECSSCEPTAMIAFYYFEAICIFLFSIDYMVRAQIRSDDAKPGAGLAGGKALCRRRPGWRQGAVQIRLSTCWAVTYNDDIQVEINFVTKKRISPPKKLTNFGKVWEYGTSAMNLVDFFAIMPFYIEIILGGAGGGFGFLRAMRLARVFRVFKMGKYNSGMTLFGRTLIKSLPALQLLAFFGLIGLVVFASMIFFGEVGEWTVTEDYPEGAYYRDDIIGHGKEPSPFWSIPRCFWWVLVTATTVGYGDMVPTSTIGKVVGSMTMIGGLLVLALPITIFGSNFANEYQKIQEEEAKDKYEREAQDAQKAIVSEMLSKSPSGRIVAAPKPPSSMLAKLRGTFNKMMIEDSAETEEAPEGSEMHDLLRKDKELK